MAPKKQHNKEPEEVLTRIAIVSSDKYVPSCCCAASAISFACN